MPRARSQRAEERELREKMRDRGMTHRQIACEFARRYHYRSRAAWRHAHGWSLTEAAEQINAYAARTGLGHGLTTVAMTSSHLCEMEGWPGDDADGKAIGRRPTPYLVSLLAAVYGCTPTDLLDTADYQHLRQADRIVLGASPDPAEAGPPEMTMRPVPQDAELHEVTAEGPATRIGAAAALAGASPELSGSDESLRTAAVTAEWADELSEAIRWAEASNVSDELLGYFDEAARQIAVDYQHLDPEPVVHRAAVLAARVTALLAGHQRLSQRRDLFVTGAGLAAFLAWACGDLGQPIAATGHARTAAVLAREAGHPGVQALAYCAGSKAAFWNGDHARALEFACQGYEICPPGTLRTLLAVQRADAAFSPADAMAAIEQARRALDEASPAAGPGGLFSCSAGRLANYAVGVHLRCGDRAGAVRLAEAGLRGCRPGADEAYGTWGQLVIGASLAYALDGDASAAAAQLAPVLAMSPQRRLATLSGRLGEVTTALSASSAARNREAADLREQIIAYQAESFGRPRPAGRPGLGNHEED